MTSFLNKLKSWAMILLVFLFSSGIVLTSCSSQGQQEDTTETTEGGEHPEDEEHPSEEEEDEHPSDGEHPTEE